MTDIRFGFQAAAAGDGGESDQRLYQDLLEDCALGSRLGYDAAWLLEHHFSDYYPTPSPLLLMAHIAARFPDLSLGTSVLVGLLWSRVGGQAWVQRARDRLADDEGPRWLAFTSAARHDLWDAGGWLVVGAAAAATLQVLVPRSLVLAVADHPALAALALGGLAVVLAICSEADAFVAASLREFSLTARLVFLVVGPAVDVKLIAMQSGMFGRRFAARFAPLTFAVAVVWALVVGRVLL